MALINFCAPLLNIHIPRGDLYMNLAEYGYKKTWQFWCVWEGLDSDSVEFDDSDLEDGEDIEYSEYRRRLKGSNTEL